MFINNNIYIYAIIKYSVTNTQPSNMVCSNSKKNEIAQNA